MPARIRRLTLSNFRNYHAATLEAGATSIVLFGPNGAGKTNLIEAISFLAPGRGLRRATLDEVAFREGDGSWAVAAEVEGALGLATLGTGIERPAEEGATLARNCRIDREPVGSAAAFADHLRVVWLVPAMDALFAGAPPSGAASSIGWRSRSTPSMPAASTRSSGRCARATGSWRTHGPTRIGSTRSSTRPRSLRSRSPACARRPCAGSRRVLVGRADSAFPQAAIALDGWMEQLLSSHPALEVEDRYRAVLRDNRARDAAAGRTLDGPHLTDLSVTYVRKEIAAADASTGEQKALLIGLVLAHARLIAEMTAFAPILLLDEVVAHLDPARRSALYVELAALGAQVWMTGADPALFAEIADDTVLVEVQAGRLQLRPALSIRASMRGKRFHAVSADLAGAPPEPGEPEGAQPLESAAAHRGFEANMTRGPP